MCASNQLSGQLQAEVNLPPAVPLYMRLGGTLKQCETNIWSNGDTHPERSVVTRPTEPSLSPTPADMSSLPHNKLPSISLQSMNPRRTVRRHSVSVPLSRHPPASP